MYPKKRLFVGLICLSLLVVLLLVGLVWYLALNRFSLINQILLLSVGSLFLILLGMVAFGIGGIVLTIWLARSIPPLQSPIRIATNLLFPIALYLGRLINIDRDLIRSSFIEVNNQLVRARKYLVSPGKVLLLTPHCLQKADCPIKITNNVQNCKRCGGCSIGSLLELTERYGVKLAVATGGTFARKFIKDYRPQAVVAIACERDLTSGIQDINPLPVVGIINERPQGPCFNTQVNLNRVENAIQYFLKGGD
ncbi:MAG: DUF116 domain-containing protein [Firmicutes bacterium]|nr:DUF116 domain-containing protein [Bacillota bacterium]